MTINKSQGQSFKHVGIYLKDNVFGHGHLYVALSRVTNFRNIKLVIVDGKRDDGFFYTKNVVYKKIFDI